MLIQELAAQPHLVQHVTDTYAAAVGTLPAADNNPFSGLKPKWSILGGEFNKRWINIVGAVWALAIGVCGFFLLRGFISYGQHRGSQHPAQVAEARGEMTNAGIALGCVLMFGVIMGVIVKVVG